MLKRKLQNRGERLSAKSGFSDSAEPPVTSENSPWTLNSAEKSSLYRRKLKYLFQSGRELVLPFTGSQRSFNWWTKSLAPFPLYLATSLSTRSSSENPFNRDTEHHKKNIFLQGDWRLLHLLAHNMNPIVFAEFVIELDNQVNLSIRWTLRRLSYHDKSKRQQYTSSSGPSTHERFCWKQWGQPTKATFSITLVICLPRIFNHAHNYIIGYLERK